ncbi:MAG: ATP-binding protein [Pseudomonadota bacterium]|nr:ATP-binding protein [Pseudomonadota bacterium]
MMSSIDHLWLLLLALLFSFVLLAVGYWIDKGRLPLSLSRGPMVFSLSLGICASVWGLFGSLGYASSEGFNFLGFYSGVGAVLLLAPIVLYPIMRLTRQYNLRSMSDIFAFRYRSASIGFISSLIMLLGLMLLFALQLKVIVTTIDILTGMQQELLIAAVFILIASVLAISFGAATMSHLDKHDGMVFAVAIASVIKILGLLLLAGYVLFFIFDSPLDMQRWFAENEALQAQFYEPLNMFSWFSGFWLLFFAMLIMPHFFHMVFNESATPENLNYASLYVPLYLLLVCVCIPLILMGAEKLGVTNDTLQADYWILGIVLQDDRPILLAIVFVAAFVTSLSVTVVGLTAISSQLVRFWLLPLGKLYPHNNFYQRVLNQRRWIIFMVSSATWLLYALLREQQDLSSYAFVAYSLVMMLAPALLGTLLWSRGTSQGVISGVVFGGITWFFLLFAPIFLGYDEVVIALFGHDLTQRSDWNLVGYVVIGVSLVLFGSVSLLTEQDEEQKKAAAQCVLDVVGEPYRAELEPRTDAQIIDALSPYVGQATAENEYFEAKQAISNRDSSQLFANHSLRDQLEQQLSGLVGPSKAYEIVSEAIPYQIISRSQSAQKLYALEEQLSEYEDELSGVAKQLNGLRNYHRQLLQDLPVAVLALDEEGKISSWNLAMQQLTLLPINEVIGREYSLLPSPWASWVKQLLDSKEHVMTQSMKYRGKKRWFDAIRTEIDLQDEAIVNNRWLIVFKEVTEIYQLQNELAHKERLASIGHLASGVAHEIGNPVTGISCLAQELIEELGERHDPSNQQLAQDILAQTHRINEIMRNLRDFSHKNDEGVEAMQPVSLREVIEQSQRLFMLDKSHQGVTFDFPKGARPKILAQSQQLIQVFINLFSNAFDAMDGQGVIRIRVDQTDQEALVSVADEGCGIPAELLSHVFEPFVTNKPVGKGTGLGLSLVHGIMEQHQGQIDVQSPPEGFDQGVEFILRFPRHA